MTASRSRESHREVYLDNNATTQPLPEVVAAMSRSMAEAFGNASSVHSAGGRARTELNGAREQVARVLGVTTDAVVFTSGATEANNLALRGFFRPETSNRRLVTTCVEHSSVLAAAEALRRRGVEVIMLSVDQDGLVDPEALAAAIMPGKTLVSVQWANNETGVLQPIPHLAAVAKQAGAVFHTDAVQAVGKIAIDLGRTAVDLLSLSGHKLHGPKGVGALIGPALSQIDPLLVGGSQELGLRPGTENIPAIVGLATALHIRAHRLSEVSDWTRVLRDRLESQLHHLGLVAGVNGAGAQRLPNTANIRFRDVDGEALTVRLDQLGIMCSQSSACTNHRPEPSYVLRAMGLSETEAYASIRFGFSELNTSEDVEGAVDAIATIHRQLARFAVA